MERIDEAAQEDEDFDDTAKEVSSTTANSDGSDDEMMEYDSVTNSYRKRNASTGEAAACGAMDYEKHDYEEVGREFGDADIWREIRSVRDGLKCTTMGEGDMWCVLDMKWLRKWQMYVNYHHHTSGTNPISSIPDADQLDIPPDEADHPGPIDNSRLVLKSGIQGCPCCVELRPGLQEDMDYCLLPRKTLVMLANHYCPPASDVEVDPRVVFITREVVRVTQYDRDNCVEMFPMKLRVHLCSGGGGGGSAAVQEAGSVLISRSSSINVLRQKLLVAVSRGLEFAAAATGDASGSGAASDADSAYVTKLCRFWYRVVPTEASLATADNGAVPATSGRCIPAATLKECNAVEAERSSAGGRKMTAAVCEIEEVPENSGDEASSSCGGWWRLVRVVDEYIPLSQLVGESRDREIDIMIEFATPKDSVASTKTPAVARPSGAAVAGAAPPDDVMETARRGILSMIRHNKPATDAAPEAVACKDASVDAAGAASVSSSESITMVSSAAFASEWSAPPMLFGDVSDALVTNIIAHMRRAQCLPSSAAGSGRYGSDAARPYLHITSLWPRAHIAEAWKTSLKVGDEVDACDDDTKWWAAFVVKVHEESSSDVDHTGTKGEDSTTDKKPASPPGSVTVHYRCWGAQFDKVIVPSALRKLVRPLYTTTVNWRTTENLTIGTAVEVKDEADVTTTAADDNAADGNANGTKMDGCVAVSTTRKAMWHIGKVQDVYKRRRSVLDAIAASKKVPGDADSAPATPAVVPNSAEDVMVTLLTVEVYPDQPAKRRSMTVELESERLAARGTHHKISVGEAAAAAMTTGTVGATALTVYNGGGTPSTARTVTSASSTAAYSSYSSYGSGYGLGYGTATGHTKGVPPVVGAVGLKNLGNTCFMASMLQCLSNTPLLTRYFTPLGPDGKYGGSAMYKKHLNTDNALGHDGKVATAYAKLMRAMWCGEYTVVTPADFKKTIGDFAPQFAGYQQQDSQELMQFLLDGLHEDCNKILKKPFVPDPDDDVHVDKVTGEYVGDVRAAQEAWGRHILRNDSHILDSCFGQLRSRVTCVNCKKESVKFDAYGILSLPLPVKTTKQLTVTVFPLPGDLAPATFIAKKLKAIKAESEATAASVDSDAEVTAQKLTGANSISLDVEVSNTMSMVQLKAEVARQLKCYYARHAAEYVRPVRGGATANNATPAVAVDTSYVDGFTALMQRVIQYNTVPAAAAAEAEKTETADDADVAKEDTDAAPEENLYGIVTAVATPSNPVSRSNSSGSGAAIGAGTDSGLLAEDSWGGSPSKKPDPIPMPIAVAVGVPMDAIDAKIDSKGGSTKELEDVELTSIPAAVAGSPGSMSMLQKKPVGDSTDALADKFKLRISSPLDVAGGLGKEPAALGPHHINPLFKSASAGAESLEFNESYGGYCIDLYTAYNYTTYRTATHKDNDYASAMELCGRPGSAYNDSVFAFHYANTDTAESSESTQAGDVQCRNVEGTRALVLKLKAKAAANYAKVMAAAAEPATSTGYYGYNSSYHATNAANAASKPFISNVGVPCTFTDPKATAVAPSTSAQPGPAPVEYIPVEFNRTVPQYSMPNRHSAYSVKPLPDSLPARILLPRYITVKDLYEAVWHHQKKVLKLGYFQVGGGACGSKIRRKRKLRNGIGSGDEEDCGGVCGSAEKKHHAGNEDSIDSSSIGAPGLPPHLGDANGDDSGSPQLAFVREINPLWKQQVTRGKEGGADADGYESCEDCTYCCKNNHRDEDKCHANCTDSECKYLHFAVPFELWTCGATYGSGRDKLSYYGPPKTPPKEGSLNENDYFEEYGGTGAVTAKDAAVVGSGPDRVVDLRVLLNSGSGVYGSELYLSVNFAMPMIQAAMALAAASKDGQASEEKAGESSIAASTATHPEIVKPDEVFRSLSLAPRPFNAVPLSKNASNSEAESSSVSALLSSTAITEGSDPSSDAAVADASASSTRSISIYSCLDKFIEREALPETETYYCRGCKQHLAPIKKMDLFSAPDVLVVQLKRFHYSPGAYFMNREKITEVVDFPIRGLDLSKYALLKEVGGKPVEDNAQPMDEGAAAPTKPAKATPNPYIYDLYAVSDHGGGLNGGHYTASAKSPIDGKWYSFNDSYVSEIRCATNLKVTQQKAAREGDGDAEGGGADVDGMDDDAVEEEDSLLRQELVTSQAYVLFYRRRHKSYRWGGVMPESVDIPAVLENFSSGSADGDVEDDSSGDSGSGSGSGGSSSSSSSSSSASTFISNHMSYSAASTVPFSDTKLKDDYALPSATSTGTSLRGVGGVSGASGAVDDGNFYSWV